MKHLLIDFDSTIPNLALMKISAWAKQKGDDVFLNDDSIEPDSVWLSCIFTWNRENAQSALAFYHFRFPDAIIHYGGTGFDWGRIGNRIELPEEIENMNPDYSLYHDDRAVGFCQRGCDRRCQFCDVWKKEGRIADNGYKRLTEWIPEGFKKVLLLDNDIALAPKWKHDEVLNDAIDMKLKISLTQGYDIRTMTAERAELLAENKPYDRKFKARQLYFSWDYARPSKYGLGIEKYVRNGVEMLKDAGFKGSELVCYVLVGFDSTFEQDVQRVEILRNELGILSYVMAYNNRRDNQNINNLRRWANRRWLYKSMDFNEYDSHYKSHSGKSGIMQGVLR